MGENMTIKIFLAASYLMFRARQIVAGIYGCYAWVVFGLVLLLCGGLAALLRKPPLGRRIVHVGAKLIFFLARIPLSAKGLGRLPAQPHMLLVNHSSFLDGIALTALLPPRPGYAFVVRQEFKIQSLLCPLLKGLGTVVLARVEPEKSGKSNVDVLTAALRRRKNLLIFPEGGFSPEPGLKPFHSGAFVASANAKVPVVVAGLRGGRAAVRPGTWMPRRVALALEIGPTLEPVGTDPAAIAQLSENARQAMLLLTDKSDPAT